MRQEAFDLRGILAVLRRRWRIVVLFAVLGAGLSLGSALLETPTYRASAELMVAPLNGQVPSNGVLVQPTEIATQMAVITSTPVAERVKSALGLSLTIDQLLAQVSVTQEGETRILDVTARGPAPQAAADVANSFASEYLAYRVEQGLAQSKEAQQVLADQAKQLRAEYDKLTGEIRRASTTEVRSLQSQQQAILVQLTQVLNAQAAAAANAPSANAGGSTLVDAAASQSPASPKPVRSAVLGLLLGLLVGVVAAFIRDRFDDALRDENRLRELIDPLPLLGRIPIWSQAATGRLVSLMDPSSPVSEAYRALGTNVRFLLAANRGHQGSQPPGQASSRKPRGGTAGQVILVASGHEAEGKTDVTSNLAVALVRYGLRVVVVDADLRLPRLGRRLGMGSPPGVTDLLAGSESIDDYLLDVEGLKVLPGGNTAPNPAELLASTEMANLISTLKLRFDVVLLDSTPLLRVADTLELVRAADIVVMVARYGETRMHSLTESLNQIRQVGGRTSGVVLVGVPQGAASDVYGQRGYGGKRVASEPEEIEREATPAAP